MKVGEIWQVKKNMLRSGSKEFHFVYMKVRIARMLLDWITVEIVDCKFLHDDESSKHLLQAGIESGLSFPKSDFLLYYEKVYE